MMRLISRSIFSVAPLALVVGCASGGHAQTQKPQTEQASPEPSASHPEGFVPQEIAGPQSESHPDDLTQQEVYGPGPDAGGRESIEKYPELAVESFTTQDGRRGWRVKLERSLPIATPAVSQGIVYVGGGFGSYEFYALDAETGKGLWLFHCGDDGPTAAVVLRDRVAFNTESCILYVLDARSGEKIWGRWLGDPLMSQPAMAGDKVFMSYPNSRGGHSISCMGIEDGKEYWTQEIPGEIITAPVIAGDAVYASTLEGSVHCFDIATGKKRYSTAQQATSAPWIWQGKTYVSVREDQEMIVEGKKTVVRTEGQARLAPEGNRENEKLWAQQTADYLNLDVSSDYAAKQAALDEAVGFGGAGPAAAKLAQSESNLGVATVSGVWAYQGSRPTIIEGVSYASMGDTLRAMDPLTGKVLWKRHIEVKDSAGGRPISPPSYANGRLYLGAVSGEIICLSARDGAELWRYDCGEAVRFQPAVAEGRVYWGTDQGSVFCLDAGDPGADGWLMWGGGPEHNGLAR